MILRAVISFILLTVVGIGYAIMLPGSNMVDIILSTLVLIIAFINCVHYVSKWFFDDRI